MNAEEGRALYEQGLRQRATAGRLFQRASEWDVPEACWEMHEALSHGGCGLDQDTDAAEYFCLRGAELGERRCRASAHIFYNYDNPMVHEATPQARAIYETYSHGLAPPVTEQDMQTLLVEAEQGDAWAAYFLAVRYARHEQEFLAKMRTTIEGNPTLYLNQHGGNVSNSGMMDFVAANQVPPENILYYSPQ